MRQSGADLASVLDDGGKLRVLPIVGRGSVQGIADTLFLKGVDLAIVRADTLDYLEKKGFANNIRTKFTYVTKLYNEEMQVVAPKTIKSLNDLEGKTVSVDLPNGGTFVTALTVFERLGIKANFVYVEQRIAMEKLKKGELDAVIVVGGKPYASVTAFNNDGRFHLAAVDYPKPLQSDYLPATLDFEGLSEPDSRGGDGGHDRSAGGACSVQLGTQHRTRSQARSVPSTPSSRNSPLCRNRPSIPSGRRSPCRHRSPAGIACRSRSNGSTNTASSNALRYFYKRTQPPLTSSRRPTRKHSSDNFRRGRRGRNARAQVGSQLNSKKVR